MFSGNLKNFRLFEALPVGNHFLSSLLGKGRDFRATFKDYKPQTFGGVLQYTSRALATYEGAKARKQAQEVVSNCALCDRDGWIRFEDSHGRTIAAKCPHNVQAIQGYKNREGLKRIT